MKLGAVKFVENHQFYISVIVTEDSHFGAVLLIYHPNHKWMWLSCVFFVN